MLLFSFNTKPSQDRPLTRLLCSFQKYCLWFCGSPRQSKLSAQQLLSGGGKKPSKKQGAALLPRHHIIKQGVEMKIQIFAILLILMSMKLLLFSSAIHCLFVYLRNVRKPTFL